MPPTDTAAVQAPPTPAQRRNKLLPPSKTRPGIFLTRRPLCRTPAPGGYTLEVPEGWARSADAGECALREQARRPVGDDQRRDSCPNRRECARSPGRGADRGRARDDVSSVDDVTLPAGAPCWSRARRNSNPDAVTNKQVRLEQNIYLLFNDGKLATLTLWAPLGADNVDQWQRIATSFRWK